MPCLNPLCQGASQEEENRVSQVHVRSAAIRSSLRSEDPQQVSPQVGYNTNKYLLRQVTIPTSISSGRLQSQQVSPQVGYNPNKYLLRQVTIPTSISSGRLQSQQVSPQVGYNPNKYLLTYCRLQYSSNMYLLIQQVGYNPNKYLLRQATNIKLNPLIFRIR